LPNKEGSSTKLSPLIHPSSSFLFFILFFFGRYKYQEK